MFEILKANTTSSTATSGSSIKLQNSNYAFSYRYISGEKSSTPMNVIVRDNVSAPTSELNLSIVGTAEKIVKKNIPENNYYGYIYIKNGITFTNFKFSVQLEAGNDVTEHELFKGQKATIILPENEFLAKIGEYEDYINEDGLLNKVIIKKVLTGNEKWYMSNDGWFYSTSFNDYAISRNIPICTHYKGVLNSELVNIGNYETSFNSNTTYKRYYIKDLRFTSVDDFVNYLANEYANNNPVTIFYLVREPYYSELSQSEKDKYLTLPTLKGTNNISITAPTSATYKTDTELNAVYAKKNYVDKKFAEQVITNEGIETRVSSTESTIGNQSSTIQDINGLIGSVNGELKELEDRATDFVTTQTLETRLGINNTEIRADITEINTKIDNGIQSTSVKTTSGTFDQDGLKIQKSGSEMKSLLNNEGLYVDKGSRNLLTCDKNGVITENLLVRTYFTVGNHRMEGYIENGERRTGVFYQGGAN